MALHRQLAAWMATATILVSADAAAAPTKGQCVDANTQGQELQRGGRLAEAREKLRICADAACPSIVQSDCNMRLNDLDKVQPTIAFAGKDPSGADVSAVTVTMDGKPLVDKLDGTPVPVDPGQHTFTFTVAGQPPITRTLLVVEGERGRREVVVLPGATATTTSAPSSAPQPAPTASVGGMGTQKVLALVAAGIGVVGVGIGSAFGLIAMSKKSDAQTSCPNQCATPDGVNKWKDAGSAADVSTIGFIVGGVGLGGAAVLWFTAPGGGGGGGTQVGLGVGSIRIQGTW
jgi:hypothetical protein